MAARGLCPPSTGTSSLADGRTGCPCAGCPCTGDTRDPTRAASLEGALWTQSTMPSGIETERGSREFVW